MKRSDTRSYLTFIFSMLVFGTIGIFRRAIPLPSGMLACVRGFLGALCLAGIVFLRGGSLTGGIEKKHLLLLILSGGLIGFNWILLFEAYSCTTVAVATLCYYMEPTIVLLLSPLLFREALTRRKLLCAVVAILGMVLVSGVPEQESIRFSELRGVLCGLGAAALYASVVLLNKSIPMENAYQKTVLQLFSAAVILLPYLLLTGGFVQPQLDLRALAMLLLVCCFHTGIAYALYFGSMKDLSAQSIAVLSYIDPVSALILSAILLKERMSPLGLLGAVLIIGAALVCELSPKRSQN